MGEVALVHSPWTSERRSNSSPAERNIYLNFAALTSQESGMGTETTNKCRHLFLTTPFTLGLEQLVRNGNAPTMICLRCSGGSGVANRRNVDVQYTLTVYLNRRERVEGLHAVKSTTQPLPH